MATQKPIHHGGTVMSCAWIDWNPCMLEIVCWFCDVIPCSYLVPKACDDGRGVECEGSLENHVGYLASGQLG